jgi:hypothetical protein
MLHFLISMSAIINLNNELFLVFLREDTTNLGICFRGCPFSHYALAKKHTKTKKIRSFPRVLLIRKKDTI